MSDATEPVDRQTLDGLCERLGIEPGFVDYQGEYHEAGAEVRRLLIEALGFELKEEGDAGAIEKQLDRDVWPEGVPPVAVLHDDRDKAVEICIPQTDADRPARWTIRCEAGETFDGHFIPAELEHLEGGRIDDTPMTRFRLRFPDELPWGYHRLHIDDPQNPARPGYEGCLIVAPPRCYCPEGEDAAEPLWGFSVQLYGVRSERNWGIGDFTDLRRFIEYAAETGADFVGVNPLHALFPSNPQHASPYSPSSRLYTNYLYLDITAIPEFDDSTRVREWFNSPATQKELERVRAVDYVDYTAVAALKDRALRWLYDEFIAQHLDRDTARARRFRAFVEREGEWLTLQAAYDALYEDRYRQTGEFAGWPAWSADFRSPEPEVVQRYAGRYPDRVGFYQYLQWLCDEQLEAVQAAAEAAGMRVGLYRDLAVGVQGGGAEAWSGQASYSFRASVGAPPDPLALQGQDWGLPPPNPRGLRQTAYAAFIKLLQANMRHTGALRIDHVMALLRLWWVPRDHEATDGAYVYYPFDDLLGILKLESRRRRCRIIGEDLGTVPEQIRGRLPEAGVYSYKVMYFERRDDRFKYPDEYRGQALATVTTHDLPTLAGWWEGVDLEMRDALGLFPTAAIREREYRARRHDRKNLLALMAECGQWHGSLDPADCPEATVELSAAVHRQLAIGRSALMAVQPEDLLLMQTPVNVPGTVDEYPNWRRKLSRNTADIFALKAVRDVLADINTLRDR